MCRPVRPVCPRADIGAVRPARYRHEAASCATRHNRDRPVTHESRSVLCVRFPLLSGPRLPDARSDPLAEVVVDGLAVLIVADLATEQAAGEATREARDVGLEVRADRRALGGQLLATLRDEAGGRGTGAGGGPLGSALGPPPRGVPGGG